jgi:hypothetical protein
MTEWIDSNIELPIKDGKYEVKNNGSQLIGICFYDGYGFLHGNHYINPDLWREYRTLEKRYGKIKSTFGQLAALNPEDDSNLMFKKLGIYNAN